MAKETRRRKYDISPDMLVEMEKRFAPEIELYQFVSNRLKKDVENLNSIF